LSLPPQAHFRDGMKTLLKELARRDLPRCVWDRPKHGFDVPLADFILGPWRTVADEVFSQIKAPAPFLDANAVQSLWQQTLSRRRNPRMLLYRLFILLVWMRERAVTVS
ncbi:MAG: asparagine synthase-related protein, partial [Gammaproteobacteria bacterium]|nr:asparagine synthase-related protein [Gammaproteobacteria bacterium]